MCKPSYLLFDKEMQPVFMLAAVAVALSGLMLAVSFVLVCIIQCSKRDSQAVSAPSSVPNAVVIATPLQEDINSL